MRRSPLPARHLVSVLTLVLLVGGCAGNPGGGGETSLTVLLADDWASAPAVADAVTDFEQEHGVRVMVRGAKFGQLSEFMIADRSGPRDIDVSQWHAFAAGAIGLAQPVTQRFADTYEDGAFVPGSIEDVTWGDDIYGVPLDVNAVVTMVNLDLLERLGHDLGDLETWDGVAAVAASAAESGLRLAYLPASTWSTYAWLRANGGHWFTLDGDEQPNLLFDSDPVVETFAFLHGLVTSDQAVPPAARDSDADAYPLFHDQQTVLLPSGTWDVARLIGDDPPFEWTVVPMPRGPSADGQGTVLGGSSLYITGHATDVDLAWAFLTHLVQPEYALRYAKEDGRLPGRTDVLADPFFDDERYRVAVDQLPTASAMKLIAFPGVLDRATGTIFDVLTGRSDARTAFTALQRQAIDIIAAED